MQVIEALGPSVNQKSSRRAALNVQSSPYKGCIQHLKLTDSASTDRLGR